MPYVTSVERIGFQIGFREGFEQGLKEGTTRIIFRQLPKRCGVLSPEMVERVQTLSLEELRDLGVSLLDFAGIQDLEAWLSRQ